MEVSDFIEIPSFTLCFHILDVFKWESIGYSSEAEVIQKELDPQVDKRNEDLKLRLFDPMLSMIAMEVGNNRTIAEFLNSTKHFEEVVFLALVTPIAMDSSWKDYNPFSCNKEYFINEMKCFSITIDSRLKRVINYEKLIFATDGNNVFAETFQKHRRPMRYYTHLEGHIPTAVDDWLTVPPEKIQKSYQRYESTLLEAPWKTKCMNYKKSQYRSRSHCRHDCFKDKISEKFRLIPLQSNAYSDDVYPMLDKFGKPYFDEEYKDACEQFKEICDKQCSRPDCYTVQFLKMESAITNRRMLNKSIVQHVVSRIPIIRIQAQASVSTTSFLTNALSTFGFWLGLSVIEFVPHIVSNVRQSIRTVYRQSSKIAAVS
jgi:hypothetical protein